MALAYANVDAKPMSAVGKCTWSGLTSNAATRTGTFLGRLALMMKVTTLPAWLLAGFKKLRLGLGNVIVSVNGPCRAMLLRLTMVIRPK